MHHQPGVRVDVRSSRDHALALAYSSQRLAALQKSVAALPAAGASDPAGGATTGTAASAGTATSNAAGSSQHNASGGSSTQQAVSISQNGQTRAAQPPSTAPDSVTRVDNAAQSRLRASQTTHSSEVNFDFEVTTQDGDKVKVTVNLLDSSTDLKVRGRSSDGTTTHAAAHSSSTSRTATISVDGNLDEGELAAIDKLASGVVDLAQSFLSGDDRGAIDKALGLNFDASELTTFALHLTQQQTQSTTRVQAKGDAALQGLAQLDSVFADQSQNIGAALRALINQPSDALDPATRAQVAQQLLPPLLGAVNVPPAGGPTGAGQAIAPVSADPILVTPPAAAAGAVRGQPPVAADPILLPPTVDETA